MKRYVQTGPMLENECGAWVKREEALEEIARLRAALGRCRDEFRAMRGPDSLIAVCEEALKNI